MCHYLHNHLKNYTSAFVSIGNLQSICCDPMVFPPTFLFVFSLFSLFSIHQATTANQSQFISLLKSSLTGFPSSEWKTNETKPFCEYTGIFCNGKEQAAKIDFSGWFLSGKFPENICMYLPELRILRLGYNDLRGDFPKTITNCSLLEELNISSTYLTGRLPNFSPLSSLKVLDLSYNFFTGDFPISITNITNLEVLNFNENGGFNLWQIPENISRLKNLKSLVLSTCTVQGYIPKSIGNMSSLIDLELSGNYLVGLVPPELGLLKNLQQLEVYYNNLRGEIPEEFGNLSKLVDLDMSVNKFSGKIPESIFRLPNLEVLQLYNNTLNGEIPQEVENSTTLTTLSLYDNFFTGKVPRGIGRFSPLVILELSENEFFGELPAEACNANKLQYFLVLENKFSGKIPESYNRCKSVLRFRVSHNYLEGSIPEGIFGLPHVSIIDLSYNRLCGPITKAIGNAKNLSELFIQSNNITGVLPIEISLAVNLVKIDLSNNHLSGQIPSEIGNLRKLNLLMLQSNKFDSSIPSSLSLLKYLNVLDLSNNILTGNIPISLSQLLPNSMNFSSNLLSGPIPTQLIKGGLIESFENNTGLCVPVEFASLGTNFSKCSQPSTQRKVDYIWVFLISCAIIVFGFVLYLKKRSSEDDSIVERDDSSSSSFFSYDVKSFHRINYDQREVFEAMTDKNIVGYGGSGTVYKIKLNNGETIAVKKLWSKKRKYQAFEDERNINKELKTEVETLGSIRHKNIVKLYSYFSSVDCSLLVYEYMPNGNLWDAIHNNKIHLSWPRRHQIALGIAQGLAYLHHDLKPPIVHRDIKTTNILLDIDYQPKVADFGIAKVLQGIGKDSFSSSSHVIAGTYWYLAPEYAYSSKATTKCDVYSFGVVLMELLTGRKPVEAEFGENKNILYWISVKLGHKEGVIDVLDKRVSELFKDEMIEVLKIAIRCTSKVPGHRPNMSEVVQLMVEADPCRCDSFYLSNKAK